MPSLSILSIPQIDTSMVLICHTNIFDPMSLNLWDPFDSFPLFGTTGGALSQPSSNSGIDTPGETESMVNIRVDRKETPNAHVLKVDLLGIWKEDIKIEVNDDRVLKISGERHHEKEERSWHHVARSISKFLLLFRLPENAKMDEVMAIMENGVLTITMPKEEVKKPKVKTLEIAS